MPTTNPYSPRIVPARDIVDELMDQVRRVQIAERIKQAREDADLTQRELADLLQVHPRTVQNWEAHKDPITAHDRLGDVATFTGVSVEWLLFGDRQQQVESLTPDLLQSAASALELLTALADTAVRVEKRLGRIEKAIVGLVAEQDVAGR